MQNKVMWGAGAGDGHYLNFWKTLELLEIYTSLTHSVFSKQDTISFYISNGGF